MRGARASPSYRGDRPGIIPAYAGSTCLGGHACPWVRDHPRVCGEHRTEEITRDRRIESSPRMRGALNLPPRYGGRAGIIPAYAGSTIYAAALAVVRLDHPRVCGEHELCSVRYGEGGGIIPAYAGSTVGKQTFSIVCVNHPRVCGEHREQTRVPETKRGSSPRMRGAHHGLRRAGTCAGIIPAYAGSTPGARRHTLAF